MKHLKKYNESKEEISLEDIRDICLELEDEGFKIENTEEPTLQDVKDILLELEDEGFKVIFSRFANREYFNCYTYTINIVKEKAKFIYDDVKEVLLRLKDYFPDELYVEVRRSSNLWKFAHCEFGETYLRGRPGIKKEKVDITNTPLVKMMIKFTLKK